jgi:hypothetical protein
MMHVYQSWTKDCKNKPGIAKVVSKPAHGTLKPTEVQSVIGVSRKNPEKTARTAGVRRQTDTVSITFPNPTSMAPTGSRSSSSTARTITTLTITP